MTAASSSQVSQMTPISKFGEKPYAMLVLCFALYNFVRIHQTARMGA
jgi:hypothetical protein